MPSETRFKRRVAVYRGSACYFAAPAAVRHLVDSGLAFIRRREKSVVSIIELTPFATGYLQGQVALEHLGAQAGSFGIKVEQLNHGQLYQHKKPWDEVRGGPCPS